ncbi:MAG: hypothetical protein H6696_17940 [Deferribacteres bacterium]|nr:hypothetical protein [candidate division KSB1 bacterium]MCB9503812.1 hypothetical protein [Deferribacteres bacterium]
MEENGGSAMNYSRFILTLALIGSVFTAGCSATQAQTRAGLAFLKTNPGARQQGFGSSLTGVLDEIHGLYANPAALGFTREWSWAASYSKWMPDVYNTSFALGHKNKSRLFGTNYIGFSASYLGVPEFDSSEGAAEGVSANDVLFGTTLAHPFHFKFGQVSLGTNIKYYRNTLAAFQASTWILDTGLMWRSKRFNTPGLAEKIPGLENVIFSAGFSMTQLGAPLKHDINNTPLPKTSRVGAAMHVGSHDGLQLHFLTDYKKILDEDGQISFGTEISWAQLITLRGGYKMEKNALGNLAMGMSLNLKDSYKSLAQMLPGRNNNMRVDLARGESNTFFDSPYQGGINHFPVGPEKFKSISPRNNAVVLDSPVAINWTESHDPDLYDDIIYHFLMDRDSLAVARVLASYDGNDVAMPYNFKPHMLDANEKQTGTTYNCGNMEGGVYYWSVVAIDKDGHSRIINDQGRNISRFDIPAPELQITKIDFDYFKWITEDDYQGKINVTIANTGQYVAKDFHIRLDDLTAPQYTSKDDGTTFYMEALLNKRIDLLEPGETRTFSLDWFTEIAGRHEFSIKVDVDNTVKESIENNNEIRASFHTIPKGAITVDDTVTAHILSKINYDLPFIAEVYFNKNSSKVTKEYIHEWVLDPPLVTLSERLQKYPELSVFLQGFIDPNSGEENLSLANARANAVRDTLLQMGVNFRQLHLLPGKAHSKRSVPADPLDAKWVFQERRNVVITANHMENILFTPVSYNDVEKLPLAVKFFVDMKSAVPFQDAALYIHQEDLRDEIEGASLFGGKKEIHSLLSWNHMNGTKSGEKSPWIGKTVNYSVSVDDSLGRRFYTQDQKFHLADEAHLREQRFSWPLKFAGTEPFYDFYWIRLFKQINRMLRDNTMRMRFIGHACAVGPENVNLALSKKRARVFRERFLRKVNSQHPESYNEILQRLDEAVGFGEEHPLGVVRTTGDFFLIGDNNSPIGRKLNRRIEISFYSLEKPLTPLENE